MQPMEQHLILVAEIMIDRRFGDAEPRSDVVERRRVKTALVEEVNSCSKHGFLFGIACLVALRLAGEWRLRSEEHTSALQSLMRLSYAVFCLKKKQKETNKIT